MKRKIISKSVLNLLVAVIMLMSMVIGFALPVSAQIPDCANPQCLNPEIYVCAGTVFNDALLEANGVTCDPAPGGPYDDGEGFTYTITRDYNFIQNSDPFGAGADLEGTAPGAGTYYYHVYCTKHRTADPPETWQDSCSCASVGYIYVYGCNCNAEDFTVCVGDVLDEQDIISMGNVSCTGDDCALDSIDASGVDTSTPGTYEYFVTCDSELCGESTCSAFVTVQECGPGCLCVAPDLTVCQGYVLTEQDFINAGADCPDPGCVFSLDYSSVDTSIPGNYTYTVHCDGTACSGSVTVLPACVATAPDITVCQFADALYEVVDAGAGCSLGCEPIIDVSQVDTCTPGCYPYTVTCVDPCGGECPGLNASGTVCVLPCVDVEIIEAAGYEKYLEPCYPCSDSLCELNPSWHNPCDISVTESTNGESMIVPVSSYFGIKAVIENCSGCILYDVTPHIVIEGPAELIPDMPDHWNLGNMEGGDDAGCTEVGWTLHCTGPGPVTVTVMVNDCAYDVVCFDQREPADLTVTCASPCETCTKCNPGETDKNKYFVTATVCNKGETEIRDATAVLTTSNPTLATISGNPKAIGTLAPGQCVDVQWEVTAQGEGDVNFTVTASGVDKCGDIELEETCTTMTRQRDALIDVCAKKLDNVPPPCSSECVDCLTVSVGQLFDIVSTITNCSGSNLPFSATLNLPAGSEIVTGSQVMLYSPSWPSGQQTQLLTPDLSVPGKATVSMQSPTLCQCCYVEITWHLVCTEPTGGDCITGTCAPYSVDATVCNKPYSSLPCNPASVCQEAAADIDAYLVGPFVEDCDCDAMVKVDVVAVGQEYDVQVCVTNSGEADATNVLVEVEISESTTCTGTYTIDFGTVPGGETVCLWLSEEIPCELICTGEEKAVIQISSITGYDENTCVEISGPITELCGLDFPQCEIDVEIVNPITCTEIDQFEVFAVKARIDNCGTCSFEDADVTLMWSSGPNNLELLPVLFHGDVKLVEGSVNPAIVPVIEAPCEDCGEDCRFYEVTWMVQCTIPGEIYFDVCVEAADPHLQIKTIESTNIHQRPRDKALVCVDILSPDCGSKYATSEEFAITAEITNLECCAPINIDCANICVGGIPWNEDTLEIVGDPMPPLPWVIQPGETKVVTWTAHCTGSGLTWFNVELEGMSDEYEYVWAVSEPVSVWQYPAAHLEVTIDDYPDEPIVTGSTFPLTFTVTNTGEADATEVYATLCVTPEGSVRIAGPSDDGYTVYLGTIPGHGSEANSVTRTLTLSCKEPCDSTIKITAEGNDEYGWHLKQECASTGSFFIEGGIESVEDLTPPFLGDGSACCYGEKGWFWGIFYGDANGLIGPFNATSPVSWVVDGYDFTGEVALMGAVLPNISLLTAEQLSYFMCHDGSCCIDNQDCDCECLCELIKGHDVMVFIGHITSDTPYDFIEDTFMCVGPGLLQIINGQFSGSYIANSQYGEIVKSLLGGEYCSNMAATAGIPIQAGFIEADEVTVKQIPAMTDLGIVKNACTCCYTVGDEACFVITVTNNGPVGAASVLVQDVLPAGLSFVSYTATQGWYDETSGFWSVGDLPYPGSATLNISATVSAAGQICNEAVIVALGQHDPVTTNNIDDACITADPAEELTLTFDEGLNLISLPLIPDDDNPVTALASVDFDTVAMYIGSSKVPGASWETYEKGFAPDAGFVWEDGYGYWMLDVASGQSLVVAGSELPEGATLPPSYDVAGGWNLIGFKSTAAKLPSEYLAGIEGKYVMIYGYDNGAFYAVGSPGHAMLTPGFGYWLAVKVGEEGTIFP